MNTFFKKIVWLIMAVPLIYLLLIWKRLPETVALHFNLNGKADRFGNKSELLTAILILLGVAIAVYLLLMNAYRIDPKKSAAENKDRLQRIAFGVAVFFSSLIVFIIYSSAKGTISSGLGLILAGTGLLFAFIGNYMQNIRPNYFAGFRLPWTLEDNENWKRTHALAGKLWFGGGLLLAATCSFIPSKTAIIVFFVVTGILTIIPIIFSYRLFKSGQKKSSEKE